MPISTPVLEVAHPRAIDFSSLRVTYWTGWLSPEMEGLSREVFDLKNHFPKGRVFGLSHNYLVKLSLARQYFGLNASLYPLFRILAPLWEAASDINHIYGNLNEWSFLKALRRRPVVMTVATAGAALPLERYARVRCLVTHSARATSRLRACGFGAALIRQIYPGVDLALFRPGPGTSSTSIGSGTAPPRLRVLFATTPHVPEGMHARGVNLLIEAAITLPDVDFIMLWRPLPGVQPLIERCRQAAPPNVHITTDVISDMPAMFRSCDATIAPFVEEAGMKVCPTSLIESLACGRPVLVSTNVGISDLIEREGGGEVFEPTREALAAAVNRLRAVHTNQRERARSVAERHFDLRRCHADYESVYEDVINGHSGSDHNPPQ